MERQDKPLPRTRTEPAQAEGHDEEAGHGLEQPPAPPAAGNADTPGSLGAAPNPGRCRPDPGGIAH